MFQTKRQRVSNQLRLVHPGGAGDRMVTIAERSARARSQRAKPRLLSIADLPSLTDEMRELIIGEVDRLRALYMDHTKSNHLGADYRVKCGSDTGRAQGIHASEISDCLRMSVYSLMGIRRRPNPHMGDLRRRFQIGHAVHAMIQNDFSAIAQQSRDRLRFTAEVPVDQSLGGVAERWELASTSDGEFTLVDARGDPYARIGLEIKSASHGEFERLRKPKPAHIEQCTVYQAGRSVPITWVLYYNKSNSNVSAVTPAFVREFDASLWRKLEKQFQVVHQHRQKRTLPARQEGFHCRMCAFAWACKPGCLPKPPLPARGAKRSNLLLLPLWRQKARAPAS